MDSTINFDSFSCRRAAMVGRFYLPRLKWQLIAYPIASVCLSLLFSVFIKIELPALVIAPLSSILSYMVYLGPLFFLVMAAREVETSLPATAGEKASFMIMYSMIVIPLLVYGPLWIVQIMMFGTIAPTDEIMRHLMPPNAADIDWTPIARWSLKSIPVNLLSAFAAILTCLYAVVSLKRNRIVLSVVYVIVYQIVVVIAASVFAGIKITRSGIFQEIASAKLTTPDAVTEEITAVMTDIMPGMMWLMGGVSLTVCIAMTYLIYRSIKRFQV
ncbi:MAG: hypothetical protein NC127_03330 [Muribaculum sp.]|nr:hypothetical protein [Muribaculum sp.]